MGNTTWLTNGTHTFEVASGSPQEKRLLAQGYEVCEPPIPGAPGEPDGSESLGSDSEPQGEGTAESSESQGEPTESQGEAQAPPAPAAPKAKAPAAPKAEG